jgi:hypothetical protein
MYVDIMKRIKAKFSGPTIVPDSIGKTTMKKDYKQVWKDLANSKKIASMNVIEMAVLRAIKSKASNETSAVDIAFAILQKAFTPITNENTLIFQRKTPFCAAIQSVWRAQQYGVNQRKWNKKEPLILGLPAEELLTEEEIERYKTTLKALYDTNKKSFNEMMRRKYVYTFVRQDISDEQQLVQAGHSLYVLGSQFGDSKYADKTHFVVVGVNDLAELMKVKRRISGRIPYVEFVEPDIGNELTAISSYPVPLAKRRFFKDYEKLTFTRNKVA